MINKKYSSRARALRNSGGRDILLVPRAKHWPVGEPVPNVGELYYDKYRLRCFNCPIEGYYWQFILEQNA